MEFTVTPRRLASSLSQSLSGSWRKWGPGPSSWLSGEWPWLGAHSCESPDSTSSGELHDNSISDPIATSIDPSASDLAGTTFTSVSTELLQ